jgi:ketosteroid isomerase-like protein
MSANVDLVRATIGAYDANDFDALFALLDPDAELHEWPEGPDSRAYMGREGILRAREEWAKAWEYIRAEPRGFVEAGDRVLVLSRSIGKGRGSSIEVELDTFGVYTIRDSKVAKVEFFTDREAALKAAGLTEDQIRQEAT